MQLQDFKKNNNFSLFGQDLSKLRLNSPLIITSDDKGEITEGKPDSIYIRASLTNNSRLNTSEKNQSSNVIEELTPDISNDLRHVTLHYTQGYSENQYFNDNGSSYKETPLEQFALGLLNAQPDKFTSINANKEPVNKSERNNSQYSNIDYFKSIHTNDYQSNAMSSINRNSSYDHRLPNCYMNEQSHAKQNSSEKCFESNKVSSTIPSEYIDIKKFLQIQKNEREKNQTCQSGDINMTKVYSQDENVLDRNNSAMFKTYDLHNSTEKKGGIDESMKAFNNLGNFGMSKTVAAGINKSMEYSNTKPREDAPQTIDHEAVRLLQRNLAKYFNDEQVSSIGESLRNSNMFKNMLIKDELQKSNRKARTSSRSNSIVNIKNDLSKQTSPQIVTCSQKDTSQTTEQKAFEHVVSTSDKVVSNLNFSENLSNLNLKTDYNSDSQVNSEKIDQIIETYLQKDIDKNYYSKDYFSNEEDKISGKNKKYFLKSTQRQCLTKNFESFAAVSHQQTENSS